MLDRGRRDGELGAVQGVLRNEFAADLNDTLAGARCRSPGEAACGPCSAVSDAGALRFTGERWESDVDAARDELPTPSNALRCCRRIRRAEPRGRRSRCARRTTGGRCAGRRGRRTRIPPLLGVFQQQSYQAAVGQGLEFRRPAGGVLSDHARRRGSPRVPGLLGGGEATGMHGDDRPRVNRSPKPRQTISRAGARGPSSTGTRPARRGPRSRGR